MINHAMPLCNASGPWGTLWCLVIETTAFAHEVIVVVWNAAVPQDWQDQLDRTTAQFPVAPSLDCIRRRFFVLSSNFLNGFVGILPSTWVDVCAKTFPHREMTELYAWILWLLFVVSLFVHCSFVISRWRSKDEVLFFPDKSGKHIARICKEIRGARRCVWLAMFCLTDDVLADELLKAHARGVDVRVIVDDEQAECAGADAQRLADAGVPVENDQSWARMHHKFAVLDHIVLSGSFNWTRQASRDNRENLCIMRDRSMVSSFTAEFLKLWREFAERGGRLKKNKRDRTPEVKARKFR